MDLGALFFKVGALTSGGGLTMISFIQEQVVHQLQVSFVRMALHSLPDPFATALFMGTLMALLGWRIGVIKLMMAGAGLGVLRSRLLSLPGLRATF